MTDLYNETPAASYTRLLWLNPTPTSGHMNVVQADGTGGLVESPIFIDNTNHRIGIQNATPSVALDVTGAINFTGVLSVGGAAGTSGYVLTSQGASTPPHWTLPTSGVDIGQVWAQE